MRKYQLGLALTIFLFSLSCSADYYVHIGGGLDRVSHDKSDRKYPMLNMKAGFGYVLSNKLALEADLTSSSSSSYNGTGTCITTTNVQVVCSKSDEVTRQLISGSAIYTKNTKLAKLFVKAGVGAVSSAYRSTIKSDLAGTVVLADKKNTGVVGLLDVGLLMKDKHRVGVIMSNNYGNSSVGTFSFVGIEYNYPDTAGNFHIERKRSELFV